MKLKPIKEEFSCEETRLWSLCHRIIQSLRDEAHHTRSDTLVSIAESIYNTMWADKLEEFADQIEKEVDE